MYKYIDDGTVFEICKSNSVTQLQQSADIVDNWSKNNAMRINGNQTKEMLIRFSNDTNHANNAIPKIVIDGVEIERVTGSKVLGVTISSNLTWNVHVENSVAKASKRLYMLYQLKRACISQNDLLRIYICVIRPVLEYACPVWHTNLPKYMSDNIEIVLKRALRGTTTKKLYV